MNDVTWMLASKCTGRMSKVGNLQMHWALIDWRSEVAEGDAIPTPTFPTVTHITVPRPSHTLSPESTSA